MSSDNDVDYSEIQSALGSIGLSTALIFGATLLSQGLGFLTRVIMARYLPVDGYGNVVIGLSILNLFGIIALAGMPAALSRYLPRQETEEECRRVLASAFQMVGLLSIVIAVCIYLLADPVATVVFGNADLVWIIRIFAGVLPFYAMLRMSIGGFRGYETTYPRVVTQNIFRPGLQLAGIVLFVSIGYGTTGIAFAYATAFVAAAAIGLWLLYRVSDISVWEVTRTAEVTQYRKLLAFSLPLVAAGAINVIAKHSDLILLGIFKSSAEVGVYEVSFRIGMFVAMLFVPAFGYLFQPIMSRFDADAERQKMDQLYTVATRWMVVASFPVFALFLLFPEQSLGFFFGQRYAGGQLALQVLVVGSMVSLLPGLTGNYLTSIGETKLLLYISSGTLVLNVGMNLALIPVYGLLGAAVATATARAFNNLVQSYYVYSTRRIHPYKRNFLLPTMVMGAVTVGIYIGPVPLGKLTFYSGLLVSGGLGVLYLVVLFGTRSVYAVEVELIDRLFNRMGIPISASQYLRLFVR